jgi:hypothetical protein
VGFSEAYYIPLTILSFLFLNEKNIFKIIFGAFLFYLTMYIHVKNYFTFLLLQFIIITFLFCKTALNFNKLKLLFSTSFKQFKSTSNLNKLKFLFISLSDELQKIFIKSKKSRDIFIKIFTLLLIVNICIIFNYKDYLKKSGADYVYERIWSEFDDIWASGINVAACQINPEFCKKVRNKEITDIRTIKINTFKTFFKNPLEWTYIKLPYIFNHWFSSNIFLGFFEMLMCLITVYSLFRKKNYFNLILFGSLILAMGSVIIISSELRYYYQLKTIIIFYFFTFVDINFFQKYVDKFKIKYNFLIKKD